MSTDTPKSTLVQFIDPEEMKRATDIDLADLTGAMQKHAAIVVEFGVRSVKAKRQYEGWKNKLEVIEAMLENHYRKTLKEENPKTTEAQIRAAVVADPRYRGASDTVADAQEIYRYTEIAVNAMEQRKDMLLQIARDAAREQTGTLRVIQNQANRDRVMEAMQANAGAVAAATA